MTAIRRPRVIAASINPIGGAVLWIALALAGCGTGPPLYDFAERVHTARVIEGTSMTDVGAREHHDRLVSGWGEPETDLSSGDSFVWATATEASVELELLAVGASVLEFRCWPFTFDGAPMQRVEVGVNGVPVGAEDLLPAAAVHSLTVPAGVLRYGPNVITFRFAYAESASDHGVDDDRTLAAAFDWIRVAEEGGAQAQAAAPGRPEKTGSGFRLGAETGVVFTLNAPSAGVLDVGVAAVSAPDPGSVHGKVWIERADGTARDLLTVDLSSGGSTRRRVRLAEEAGSRVRIGFAVSSTTAQTEETPTLEWLRPLLYGDQAELEPITNVLLIVLDTLRADFVGAYGGRPTPNFDALAARGVMFSNVYSHIPITGPSHASMFTSVLPFEHGVHNNAQILDGSFQTLAESLHRNGWYTSAVVSLAVLERQYGTAQGFDVYLDDFGYDFMKDAREITEEAVRWLEGSLAEPFFMWVHYSDPHEPYTPPGLAYPRIQVEGADGPVAIVPSDGRAQVVTVLLHPGSNIVRFSNLDPEPSRWFRFDVVYVDDPTVALEPGEGWRLRENRMGLPTFESPLPATMLLEDTAGDRPRTVDLHFACKQRLDSREARERYLQEVEFADRQIGALLDALQRHGVMDRTLVIFTSDHGEGLGDHNHVGHISQLYDTLLRVPLILVQPGVLPSGAVVEDDVGLIDLYPTVAELLAVPGPSGARGRSLVPLIRGGDLPIRPLVAETYRPESFSDKRALVANGFKYIHSCRDREWEEVYDLRADPAELNDLAPQRPGLLEELRAILEHRLATAEPGTTRDVELSEQDAARLRALGYVR
jgi:arylsulfatase A-like enzyme